MLLLLCDYFYVVVLFSFLCCFIDEGAVKLGEGTDVVAPVHRGFLLFFIISILSVILLFICVVNAEVWSEGSIFFLARLCKQKLCRRRIKGQKRQSLQRTGSASASRGDTTISQAQTKKKTKKKDTQIQKDTRSKQTSKITGTTLAARSRQTPG